MELNSVVTQIRDISEDTRIIRVRPKEGDCPAYVAGQFISLALPGSAPKRDGSDPDYKEFPADKLIRRAYSIASAPETDKGTLEFIISYVKDGALTPRLFHLKRGDDVELAKKCIGHFTLEHVEEGKNIVMLATGTGCAPFIGFLRGNLLSSGKFGKITLLHGCRHSEDLGYLSEFTLLDKLFPDFNYVPMVSRPKNEIVPWEGTVGYVQEPLGNGKLEEMMGVELTPENSHFFMCGNQSMIKQTQEILDGRGFVEHTKKQTGNYHIEEF